MVTNARWGDAARTFILAERDGAALSIPADPENRDYRLLMDGDAEAGTAPAVIADFAAPAPSAHDVRAEASRRILAVYPLWKQQNMTARAIDLLRKGEARWTRAEAAQAAALDAAFAWIKSVRAASNTMESGPPHDFASNARWPAPPDPSADAETP
jgi:hypothetical protein